MYFTKPAHALAHAHVTVRLRTVPRNSLGLS